MTGNEWRKGPYPLGATCETDGIHVAFVSSSEECSVLLYEKETGRLMQEIPFEEEDRIGNIYFKLLKGMDASRVSYQFCENGRAVPDPYARCYVGKMPYGERREAASLKAGFITERFDWGEDWFPRIPYENSICYLLHVRGFTRHASSGVAHKGTFAGVAEKIPYLKKLGITTVELQPAYEFLELEEKEGPEKPGGIAPGRDGREPVLNYWGYRKGFYYAPKGNYAWGEDSHREFCSMVKAFHENGMEVIMQFYFPREVYRREIPDILLYWVMEYHVDGFHLMGEQLPTELIVREAGLADTKLWFSDLDMDWLLPGANAPKRRTFALYCDDYMYDLRRFLKGDSDMLGSVVYHMRKNPPKAGKINYLTNYYGFTMMDLVSYNEKHNEGNGENNRDGSDYNQSWNCGVEGSTRRKQVVSLRRKQYKNAMAMLFSSQATPLLFMGDEFGNSQKGNNNPYCQDNEIAWLDWNNAEKNAGLLSFTRDMIAFRNAHPVLHQPGELQLMDTMACGYPDLSYHGEAAWRPSMERTDRQIGMMYCGKYARTSEGNEDDFLYLAYNMHWEAHDFALPRLPKDMEWKLLFMTEEAPAAAVKWLSGDNPTETKDMAKESSGKAKAEAGKAKESYAAEQGLIRKVPPRTVAVFIGRGKKLPMAERK